MCTQWFSDAMALAGYVTMMVMMKLNYQSCLSSVATVICHWLGLNCEEMCQWLLMSQVTGCAGQKCRVQVDLHSPANACSRHKHKLMRFVIGCNLYCVNSPSKYYYYGLPRSAIDRDQIVAYSLRSRAIKRKTDRDQQACSYTTRHDGVLSIKCRCRCLADYKHSMGRAGRWGVSESVAAAATRAVLR